MAGLHIGIVLGSTGRGGQEVGTAVSRDTASGRSLRIHQCSRAESRTSSGSKGGGKTYRRADLIRLKMENPSRYESLQDEIFEAYADGRVV